VTAPELLMGGAVGTAAALAILFHAVTRPADAGGFTQATKDRIMATIAEAASAVEGAATSLNSAAQGLNAATDAIKALVAGGDTSALDQPLADLTAAVTAVSTASDAIKAALPA